MQKVEAFNEKYKFLRDKYKCMQYGLNGELPKNNIQEAVKKEKKHYLTKVTIIKLKYQSKIYRELIKEALNKFTPFDKSEEKRKSDAGFKDALNRDKKKFFEKNKGIGIKLEKIIKRVFK